MQAGQTSSTLSNLLTSIAEVWKCVVTPDDGTSNGPTAQDNVTINGTIIPTYAVNLISPSSGASWTSSNTVTFQYNTSLNATNCSLIINSAVDQTDTNITANATETFTKSLSNAAYTWSVNCTDINNITNSSATWSLSVSYSSGGGGGGGSSRRTIIPTTNETVEEIETTVEQNSINQLKHANAFQKSWK